MTITRSEVAASDPWWGLYLFRYRIFLEPLEEIRLPEFKGSSLRGVFGHALRQVACVIQGEECALCPLRGGCAYAILFESFPPEGFPDAGKYQSFPRPYIINPPVSRKLRYLQGEPLVFDLVLVGRAVEHLSQVIGAFEAIGQAGFNKGQGRFAVERVDSLDASGSVTPVYAQNFFHGFGAAIGWEGPTPAGEGDRVASVHFLTPTRFEVEGKLQDAAPKFEQLLRMLARRVALLSALYCEGPQPEQALASQTFGLAQQVRIIDSHLEWREHERYSSRQQTRMRQGGVVGAVVYHGPIGPYLAQLELMKYLNIGKSTTFGLGRVALSFG